MVENLGWRLSSLSSLVRRRDNFPLLLMIVFSFIVCWWISSFMLLLSSSASPLFRLSSCFFAIFSQILAFEIRSLVAGISKLGLFFMHLFSGFFCLFCAECLSI